MGQTIDLPPPHTDDDNPNATSTVDTPRRVDDRPIVIYSKGDEFIAQRSAIGTLAAVPNIYARGSALVQVLSRKPDERLQIDRDSSAPVISPLGRSHLRTICSEAASWHKFDGRKNAHVKCTPPAEVIGGLFEAGAWPGLPVIDGVATVPVLRPDGSIWDEPGHDAATRYVYRPPYAYPDIIENPTRDDANAAAAALAAITAEFPISNEGGRPAWVALVLSMIARQAFEGPAPLTVIDATTPGTGKTLMADAAAMIATGRSAARTPWADDDEELRKRITSIAMAGDPVVLLDNLPQGQMISAPCLDAALTATTWRDRILGRSEMVEIPMLACWIATGNNVSAVGDTMRRSLRIRLEADTEKPEERDEFKNDPLLPHLRNARPQLVIDALTMLRAYILAGSPKQDLTRYGSFEGWSSMIRSSIVWSGLGDPCAALISGEPDADTGAGAHVRLMMAWKEMDITGGGLTAKGVLSTASKSNDSDLRDAIEDITPQSGGGLPTAHRLSTLLRQLRGRWRPAPGGGARLRFEPGDSAAGGARRWVVVRQGIDQT